MFLTGFFGNIITILSTTMAHSICGFFSCFSHENVSPIFFSFQHYLDVYTISGSLRPPFFEEKSGAWIFKFT
jgi:hypothetical protein